MLDLMITRRRFQPCTVAQDDLLVHSEQERTMKEDETSDKPVRHQGLPGIHKGMIDTMLLDPTRVADVNNPTAAVMRKA